MEDDHKFIDHLENDKQEESIFQYLPVEHSEEEINRYPVTDPKKPFVCQHCGVGKLCVSQFYVFYLFNFVIFEFAVFYCCLKIFPIFLYISDVF